MNDKTKKHIEEYLKNRVAGFGFAPVERFNDAPKAHHPDKICKNPETIIVFAIACPRGMLFSPDYHLYAMQRIYHTVYNKLDEIAVELCNVIESSNGNLAVPIPSYAPLVFHGMEPWGMLSLKHAAVNAGLGAFGKNGLVHNPHYGTLLRFGAVVTNVKLPGDDIKEDSPCPEECNACHRACPPEAFDEKGNFAKLTCLGHTIKHAIYPIALKDKQGLKHIERIINTAGHNYWLECNECIRVCPNNRK